MQRTRTGGPENKDVETSCVGYVPKVVENLVLCTKSSGKFGSKHSKILKNSYLIVNCFSFSNDYILSFILLFVYIYHYHCFLYTYHYLAVPNEVRRTLISNFQ